MTVKLTQSRQRWKLRPILSRWTPRKTPWSRFSKGELTVCLRALVTAAGRPAMVGLDWHFTDADGIGLNISFFGFLWTSGQFHSAGNEPCDLWQRPIKMLNECNCGFVLIEVDLISASRRVHLILRCCFHVYTNSHPSVHPAAKSSEEIPLKSRPPPLGHSLTRELTHERRHLIEMCLHQI